MQKNWTNFQDLVDNESKILNEKLNKIKAILINLGYKGNFEQNTLNIFLKDLKDLIKTSKENNLYHSETEIDNHTNMFETQLNQFLKNINELESGINDNNRLNILIYNSFNPFGLENSLKLFLDIENFAKEIESVTNVNVEQTDQVDDTLKEIKDKLIEVIKEND